MGFAALALAAIALPALALPAPALAQGGPWDDLARGFQGLGPLGRALVYLAPFALGALLTLFVAIALRRRGSQNPSRGGLGGAPASDRALGPAFLPGASAPKDIFPSEWLAKADPGALGRFVDEASDRAFQDLRAALVRRAKGDKGDKGALEPLPDTAIRPGKAPFVKDALDMAADAARRSLRDSLGGDALYEALGEGGLAKGERALATAHLRELMPAYRLPQPPPPVTEARIFTVALLGALGAFFGDLSGAALAGFLGQPQSAGALLGAVLGAFLPVALSVWLAQHRRLRVALMAALGAAAVVDAAIGVIRVGTLSGILGGGGGGRLKRLFLYLAAFLILLLAKGKESFDSKAWEATVRESLKAYLSSAIPMLTVLLYRMGSMGAADSGDAMGLLAETVALVKRLLAKGGEAGEGEGYLLSDLRRKLSLAGFEMGDDSGPAGAGKALVWSESMKSSYDTFGHVRPGESVTVEEEPVTKDGRVLRKGQVVPS
ncbi:MAG: hypothetical protein LBF40_00045 [Deltaproteobacteria bacterium]|nr:hypothetical protein [Deltaproteobacteria bacterium]